MQSSQVPSQNAASEPRKLWTLSLSTEALYGKLEYFRLSSLFTKMKWYLFKSVFQIIFSGGTFILITVVDEIKDEWAQKDGREKI